jgi:two-component sensor histidine kinase
VLQSAFGASEALASIIRLHREDPQDCSEFLRAYQEQNSIYTLVSYIQADGIMNCSSTGETFDLSQDPGFKQAIEKPYRRTQTLQNGPVSQRTVTVVTSPVLEQDELIGIIAMSIPPEAFSTISEPDQLMKPLALMTFNRNGEIITSERGFSEVSSELPADVALAVFTDDQTAVFLALNSEGVERYYAVRPLVQDAIFAVSVWPKNTPILNPSIGSRLGAFIPIIMWAASLVVAFWALNRLAIRHIRKLGRQMRRFALNRNLPRETLGSSVPTELVEMEQAFIRMGESILRDEAQLEDSLREKNILLKEVHHRVKNNLQLISSIMNMQIRQAKTAESSFVLRRLQERILSLATVHKNLYQNDNLARVDAAVLLNEVVNQILSVGLGPGSNVKVEKNFEPISLDADDAAPLTLLVSEAMTNALKYVAHGSSSAGSISIKLVQDGPERAVLSVFNTKGGKPEEDGTGLGGRLIHAFARQLNGQVEIDETDEAYAMRISFPVPLAAKQVYDY